MASKVTGLGAFNDFWDGEYPHHLPFLNWQDSENDPHCNLSISLGRVKAIIEQTPRHQLLEDMKSLLQQDNWRPHLLFCASLFFFDKELQAALLSHLWTRLTAYRSMVVQQLAVTASILDTNFEANARKALIAQGVIGPSDDHEPEALLRMLCRGSSDHEDRIAIGMRWRQGLLGLIAAGKIRVD